MDNRIYLLIEDDTDIWTEARPLHTNIFDSDIVIYRMLGHLIQILYTYETK